MKLSARRNIAIVALAAWIAGTMIWKSFPEHSTPREIGWRSEMFLGDDDPTCYETTDGKVWIAIPCVHGTPTPSPLPKERIDWRKTV